MLFISITATGHAPHALLAYPRAPSWRGRGPKNGKRSEFRKPGARDIDPIGCRKLTRDWQFAPVGQPDRHEIGRSQRRIRGAGA